MDVFENRGCWGVSWRVTLYPRAAPTFLSSSKSAGTIDLLCPYSHLLHVCGWSGFPSGYYLSTASPLTVRYIELLPSLCVICPYCDPSRTSIDVIFSCDWACGFSRIVFVSFTLQQRAPSSPALESQHRWLYDFIRLHLDSPIWRKQMIMCLEGLWAGDVRMSLKWTAHLTVSIKD